MKSLGRNWITDRPLDSEHKRYLLLAYLKEVAEYFTENRLYPKLSELVTHLNDLAQLRSRREQSFRKDLTGLDWEKLELKYDVVSEDPEWLKTLDEIIAFALPELEGHVEFGKEIYEWVEASLFIEPLGLVPLKRDSGFLFFREPGKKEVRIFSYELSLFNHHDHQYRSLKTNLIKTDKLLFGQSPEQMKWELLKEIKVQTIPATFYIESHLDLPWKETYFPVAKRYLMRYLSEKAA